MTPIRLALCALLLSAPHLSLARPEVSLTEPDVSLTEPDVSLTEPDVSLTEQGRAPHGRYVEARTASVFAGPCHYNGELMTGGREALLAWSFEGGAWNGVSLAGLRAVAAVAADRNLDLEGARRESVLYVDATNGESEREALRALLTTRYAAVLGRVIDVRTAPIALAFPNDGYRLAIDGVAALEGVAMPDRACCSMPESVWYRPLIAADAHTQTAGVLVGNSSAFRYGDERVAKDDGARWTLDAAGTAPRWARSGANDSLLATFRIEAARSAPLGRR